MGSAATIEFFCLGLLLAVHFASCIATGDSSLLTGSRVVSVPAFFWANQAGVLRSGNNAYVGLSRKSLHQSEIGTFVDFALSSERLKNSEIQFLGQDSHRSVLLQSATSGEDGKLPSVVAVYLSDSLNSSQLSSYERMSQLVSESAGGSVIAPYTEPLASGISQNEALGWWEKYFPKVATEVLTASQVSVESLESELKSKLIEKNPSTENPLVLIFMVDSASGDQMVSSIDTLLRNKLGNNELLFSVFTAANNGVKQFISGNRLNGFSRDLQTGIQGNEFLDTEVIRVSPAVIFGMIISLLFVCLMVPFVLCMHDIQSPSRFVKKYPPLGKVFH